MPLTTPVLTIDLSAIAENYRRLRAQFTGKSCAAVVKADAYGLGAAPVAQALRKAGCQSFYVATFEEAVALRAAVPDTLITVFHGPYPGEEDDFLHAEHSFVPVINSLEQMERWEAAAKDFPNGYFNLHVDTGMCRLGLTESDCKRHLEKYSNFAHDRQSIIMSHLACANDPADPKNAEQLARFRAIRTLFPQSWASLSNSSGIFLSPDFHFDLARPGCALYGITPVEGNNPMAPVVTLRAPIIQIRTLDRDETIGYGATAARPKGSRIAIIQLGYADGYLRHLSNKGEVEIAGHTVPILGRVSMDMIAADITSIPENKLGTNAYTEILNCNINVNKVATAGGTIGYEVLTRIGSRVKRDYKDSTQISHTGV